MSVCLSGTSSIRVSSSFSLQSLSGLSQSHVWFRSLSGLSPLSGLFSLQALCYSILAYFVEHTESKILRLVQFLKHPKIDQTFIPARPSPSYIIVPLSVWLTNQASFFFLRAPVLQSDCACPDQDTDTVCQLTHCKQKYKNCDMISISEEEKIQIQHRECETVDVCVCDKILSE